MKRIISCIISAAVLLSFSACSDEETSKKSTEGKETVEMADKLSDSYVTVGINTGMAIKLPSDFTVDEENKCYTNGRGISIWLQSATGFINTDDMKLFMGGEDNGESEKWGDYTIYMVSDKGDESVTATRYYVDFNKTIGDYRACSILVTDSSGEKSLVNTQSDIIRESKSSITEDKK